MKYCISVILRYSVQSRNIKTLKNIFRRWASTGLNQWNSELTPELKHDIERYWKEKIHKTQVECSSKEKFYVLPMFPYPSGALHMGHVRVYTISDAIARFYRMQGKNVIHPIGWDSFGLPAENAAIEREIDPAKWTESNIKIMREQLYQLGCTFDKEREISTSDPQYYKWTQELFLKLYENDLVYKKEAFVNWDPIDETVLADEQVDEEGKSWRSGAIVQRKLLNQWFIKTTAFAQSLILGLKDPILKEWRDIIRIQKHWIGECTGTNIEFRLTSEVSGYPKSITLFTEVPEYIKDAKFVALSQDNLLSRVENNESEHSLVRKLNVSAINPFTNEILPVYVTSKEYLPYLPFRDNYIGFPCLSTIDAEFCKSNHIHYTHHPVYTEEEGMQKRLEILNEAQKKKLGGYLVSSKLRDWLISRQRYWGTPIPIVHCPKCGSQPVPRIELPVVLPKVEINLNKKKSLISAVDWLKATCPHCKGPATRETDTMDTFVDSSWYFIRYIDPRNENEMFSREKARQYLPVDLYIGGKEHANLHLYYARFINHFLHHIGLLPTREPFKQLLVQGMVKGLTYTTSEGKYLKAFEVEEIENGLVERSTKLAVKLSWEKMSKSKFNGVDPVKACAELSTDTVRLLILADVAPTSDRFWSKETYPGILNWENRLWRLLHDFISSRKELTVEELESKIKTDSFMKDEDYMFDSRNYYINGVTFNIVDAQQMSVAISKMQGLTNSLKKVTKFCLSRGHQFERTLAVLIIMLAPIAPHFSSELWAMFCSAPHRIVNNGEIQWDKDVLEQVWPSIDMEYNLKVRVQVNNKNLTFLRVPQRELEKMSEDDILKLVMENEKFQKKLVNKEIKAVSFQSRVGCGANINIKLRGKQIHNLNCKDMI